MLQIFRLFFSSSHEVGRSLHCPENSNGPAGHCQIGQSSLYCVTDSQTPIFETNSNPGFIIANQFDLTMPSSSSYLFVFQMLCEPMFKNNDITQ